MGKVITIDTTRKHDVRAEALGKLADRRAARRAAAIEAAKDRHPSTRYTKG